MSDHTALLQQHGFSITKHRQLLLQIIDESSQFLTADQLYLEMVKQDASISLSTVYRIVEAFTQKGILHKMVTEGSNQSRYEIAHEHHCHHLICTKCQKVIHIEGCPIHTYEEDIAKHYGFHVVQHKLELYGVCEACQQK